MSALTRKLLIGLAALVVIAIIGAIFFIIPASRDSADNAVTATEPSSSASTPPPGSVNSGQGGFGTPVVDVLGRQVTVPNNAVGQPLPQVGSGQGQSCTPAGGSIASPGGVQIQQTTALVTLVSSTDGPARTQGNVLTGYTHSPQGAALAGWNWFGRSYGPGPVSKDAYEMLTVHTDELAAQVAGETWDSPGMSVGANFPAPDAFRISSCTTDFASVEYAIDVPFDNNGQRHTSPVWKVLRTSMFYIDGEWKGRLDQRSIEVTDNVTDITAFTRWSFA